MADISAPLPPHGRVRAVVDALLPVVFGATSAAALAAETGDFKSALEEATAALDSGNALTKLNELVEYSQSLQPAQ